MLQKIISYPGEYEERILHSKLSKLVASHNSFIEKAPLLNYSLNFRSILLETALITCNNNIKRSTLTDINNYDILKKSIILRDNQKKQLSYPRSLDSFKYLNTMKGNPFIILKNIDFCYIFLNEVYLLLKQDYKAHSDDIINSYKMILQDINNNLANPINSYEIFKSPLNKIETLFSTKMKQSIFYK